ncbi:MAG: hypothetical protein WBM83_13980 [Flavobacteriaceae bacterium]
MKRITTILLLFIFMISCSKDADDVINVELEGKWTLAEVYCYCGFTDNTDFSTNKITFAGSILSVENSGEYQFLSNAAGNYTVDGNLITFKSGQQYSYVVNGTLLELTFVDDPGIADDELLLVFEKS